MCVCVSVYNYSRWKQKKTTTENYPSIGIIVSSICVHVYVCKKKTETKTDGLIEKKIRIKTSTVSVVCCFVVVETSLNAVLFLSKQNMRWFINQTYVPLILDSLSLALSLSVCVSKWKSVYEPRYQYVYVCTCATLDFSVDYVDKINVHIFIHFISFFR